MGTIFSPYLLVFMIERKPHDPKSNTEIKIETEIAITCYTNPQANEIFLVQPGFLLPEYQKDGIFNIPAV